MSPVEPQPNLPADRLLISPPVPAPYLDGVAPLPDALLGAILWHRRLSPALDLELAYELRIRLEEIRRRRAAYESANHVVIESERPYAP
jgi:hypothetical protein